MTCSSESDDWPVPWPPMAVETKETDDVIDLVRSSTLTFKSVCNDDKVIFIEYEHYF